MQQTSFEPTCNDEQNPARTILNKEKQAKQWLEENREAIDAYFAQTDQSFRSKPITIPL